LFQLFEWRKHRQAQPVQYRKKRQILVKVNLAVNDEFNDNTTQVSENAEIPDCFMTHLEKDAGIPFMG